MLTTSEKGTERERERERGQRQINKTEKWGGGVQRQKNNNNRNRKKRHADKGTDRKTLGGEGENQKKITCCQFSTS